MNERPGTQGIRYVVTEIEGYNQLRCSGTARVGLSCHVLDTATNNRTVATFRTEDLGRARDNVLDKAPTQAQRFEIVRERAATRCDLLNRLDEIAREAQGAVA